MWGQPPPAVRRAKPGTRSPSHSMQLDLPQLGNSNS